MWKFHGESRHMNVKMFPFIPKQTSVGVDSENF